MKTRVLMLAATAMICAIQVGCAVCLNGCPRLVTFNEEEYEPFAMSGTGSISGDAFLTQRGGRVVVAAGKQVTLTPKTSYSREWYQRTILRRQPLKTPDHRASHYDRTTWANRDGEFFFLNLPEGEYYISTRIEWDVMRDKYGLGIRADTQGGLVVREVSVGEGQVVENFVVSR